jgi:hypothetical protein
MIEAHAHAPRPSNAMHVPSTRGDADGGGWRRLGGDGRVLVIGRETTWRVGQTVFMWNSSSVHTSVLRFPRNAQQSTSVHLAN